MCVINDNKDNSDNAIGGLYGLKAQKEPSPGQSETSWSGTLGKMYPDGPRPTGARGNVRNVFPDGTSNVPCCHFAFPFGRRPSVQGAGYVGGPIPRVPSATLILPWARFLLPLRDVRFQMHCRTIVFFTTTKTTGTTQWGVHVQRCSFRPQGTIKRSEH